MANETNTKARLQDFYEKEIVPALQKKFNYKNPMQVPKLEKIVLNMGVGEGAQDKKVVVSAVADMTAISGQKPIVTKAKKSIAGFKLRQGIPIGCKVTLRSKRMYEFLDRLTLSAMPRIRDFRGLNAKQFDGAGNFTFGIKEQVIFPEINYDKIDKIRGMDITFVTTANTNEEGKELLSAFHLPFRN